MKIKGFLKLTLSWSSEMPAKITRPGPIILIVGECLNFSEIFNNLKEL